MHTYNKYIPKSILYIQSETKHNVYIHGYDTPGADPEGFHGFHGTPPFCENTVLLKVSRIKTFPVLADQTPSTKALVFENLIWMCGSIVEAPIRDSKIAKILMKANSRKF